MKMPNINFDTVIMSGGLDQVTPILSLRGGFVKHALNFEVSTNGGYSWVEGYERFDGRTSPSDSVSNIISVGSITTLNIGDTITGVTSSATAVVSLIDGLKIYITKIVGIFVIEEIKVGTSSVGTINNLDAGPGSIEEDAKMKAAGANIYRTDILAVPGSGAVLGVVALGSVVYAFRGGSIYKSSSAGWVNVPLYKTISFTAGAVATPLDGSTLTQGAVTATIKRVMLESGEFTGSNAAGTLIIDGVTGGNFSAGAATIGATTLTLSGIESQISISSGGRYEFAISNFFGSASTRRVYGCDGINKPFEFDGDVYAPINSPIGTHIIKHRDFLVVSSGASFFYSVSGEPYNFTGAEGSGEIATGDVITGFLVMPGDSTNSTLIVYNRSDYGILYGKTQADFNFVQYDIGTGAVDYTMQNMTGSVAFDDRGISSLKTTLSYGNFVQDTITSRILPYINNHIGQAIASTINRRKSQYRLFFNNGDVLYSTIINGKHVGSMPITFLDIPFCTFAGKLPSGEDVSFFGSENGFVYQMDKGSSFDGQNIETYLEFNYTGSNRILKRYRKCSIELSSPTLSFIELFVGYSLGYDSDEYAQSDIGRKVQTSLGIARWGDFFWGKAFWGSSGLAPAEISLAGTSENIAIIMYGSSAGINPFTINSFTINYTSRRVMR